MPLSTTSMPSSERPVLSVRPVKSHSSKRLTKDPLPERALRYTPDGSKLAFVHGNGNLVTMKPDGFLVGLFADGTEYWSLGQAGNRTFVVVRSWIREHGRGE